MKNIENLPASSGIYMVVNLINNKKYIGQSKNIKKRFQSHHLVDYKNKNNCNYNTKFYQALRKYGIDSFEVIILKLCEEKELDDLEIKYIKEFDTFKNGYNSTEGGQYWSPNIHSGETELKRQKTREQNKSLMSENHPRAKLTNQQVWDIRQRYIDGKSIKEIYQDFKDLYSNQQTFKRIVLGQTYVTVGNIPNKEQVRHTNAKLTDVQVKEIRNSYKKGVVSYRELGEKYGLSESSIAAIIKRETYKNVD